ncbi:hypothetical protein Ddye_003190 [Dipteronia dyeriana]|uniref:sucrose synthase n=1 Tax=Dipteronia dyeriana TaxID=168575 RepID=A0AAE0CV53_9ROSI|nr:hypothetical protein Ddye_003190 [Dipteronia dyeriana]
MASSPSFKRSDTISGTMPEALRQSRYHTKKCFARFVEQGKRLMKRQHLMGELEKSIEDKNERSKVLDGLLGYILSSTQDAAVVPPYVALAVRPNPGYWEFVNVNADDLSVDEINVIDYLKFKEMILDENWAKDENALEIDFGAVDFTTPHLTLSSSIGNGMNYISKFMSSRLISSSDKAKPLVDYLLDLNHRGENLMINESLSTVEKLQAALIVAEASISELPKDTISGISA